MSEGTQNAGGAGEGNPVGDPKPENTVSHETYKRVLDEAKKAKARASELEKEKADREQAALAEQGKFKEALEKETTTRRDLETRLKDKDKTYAKHVFTVEAKKVAQELGAMPEALEDIIKVGDWSGVEVDSESFKVNETQLKEAVLNLQKSKPFYFSKTVAAPRDNQSSAGGAPPGPKPADKLSKDEILQQLKALPK